MAQRIILSTLILFCLFFIQISIAYPTYEDYLHDFNKTYSSQEEITRRKQIYDSRVTFFSEITSFEAGVNNFTDWTEEEIQRIKSYQPLEPEDYAMLEQVEYTSYLRVSSSPSPSPDSLDWRTKKAVTSVKDQGSQCGSCWAFAAAAYVESKLIIEKNYSRNVDLSEQYLLSCTPRSSCNGGYTTEAMNIIAKGGIPYESSYPYNPTGYVDENICNTQNKVREAGSRYRVIFNATDDQLIDLLQLGPIVIPISSNNWYFYQSGVLSCQSNAASDHAVLLVGYTSSYWIVKNQWGSNWGESGYIKINRSRTQNYTNCYIGSYAVFMDPVNIAQQSSGFIHQFTLTLLVSLLVLLLM